MRDPLRKKNGPSHMHERRPFMEILPGGETRLEALHVSPLQGPYDHKVPTGFASVGELKLYGQGGIRSATLSRGAPRGLRPS